MSSRRNFLTAILAAPIVAIAKPEPEMPRELHFGDWSEYVGQVPMVGDLTDGSIWRFCSKTVTWVRS